MRTHFFAFAHTLPPSLLPPFSPFITQSPPLSVQSQSSRGALHLSRGNHSRRGTSLPPFLPPSLPPTHPPTDLSSHPLSFSLQQGYHPLTPHDRQLASLTGEEQGGHPSLPPSLVLPPFLPPSLPFTRLHDLAQQKTAFLGLSRLSVLVICFNSPALVLRCPMCRKYVRKEGGRKGGREGGREGL